jgi:hypothetical protein
MPMVLLAIIVVFGVVGWVAGIFRDSEVLPP